MKLVALALLVALQESAPPDPIPVAIRGASPERLMAAVETLVSFHTRHTLSETESDERGIGAARRWLRAELERIAADTGGRMTVAEQRFRASVQGREAEIVNVYAFLPGTEAGPLGRTYVVSGHYDSRAGRGSDADAFAPGANDDASGTAVVLEVARLLAPHEFRANLVFLLVAAEEQGLVGAKHFASEAKAAGWDIDGMITNDIVGGVEGGNGVSEPRTIRCYSDAEGLHSTSRALSFAALASVARYVPDARIRLVFRADRIGRGGDHQAFSEQGFPAFRFTEANEHYARQHQDVREEDGVRYGDLPEHVSAPYMALVAQCNVAVLAELALAPPAPTAVRMRAAVSYDTQLGWSPSPGEVAGYEVVWRETTEPTWSASQPVEPIVRELTTRGETRSVVQARVAGVSADTHFFGVRAVSPGGHRSRAALPDRP